MSELSLGATVRAAKHRAAVSVVLPEGNDLDDYADLDDAGLPKNAAVQLADETGRPVGDFMPTDIPIPDFEEQEVEYE